MSPSGGRTLAHVYKTKCTPQKRNGAKNNKTKYNVCTYCVLCVHGIQCTQVAHLVKTNIQKRMTDKTMCKVAGCEKHAVSHGTCRTHYKMLLKMVRKGDTTWQELESKGITTPAQFTKDPKDRLLLENFLAQAFSK